MPRVVVTGATGMIGRALVSALVARGEEVVVLSRDAQRARQALGDGVEAHAWPSPLTEPPPEAALAGADAVVHLLGEPIAQRWTDEAKEAIRESRVRSTHALVEGLLALAPERRPRTLVSQSAVGFYGPRDDQPVDEQAPAGNDFLAEVVVAWEREALAAASSGVRVVVTRTGVVLSPPRAARSPRCSRSSASGSAVPSPAAASTSPGCTSTTSSARCCSAPAGPRPPAR